MKTLFAFLIIAASITASAQGRSLSRVGGTIGFPDQAFAASPAQQAAQASINAPVRIAFPSRSDDYMRKFYQSRSKYLFMAGTNLIERSRFGVTGNGVIVGEETTKRGVIIGQHLGQGLYLVKHGDMALQIGDETVPEGVVIYGHVEMDGLYSYVTVTGARRQIQRAILHQEQPATYEQFLAAVESGFEFKTTTTRTVACSACNGSKVQPKSNRSKGMKRLCETCSGHGTQSATMAAVYVANP